jgi:hypothetical protein
MLKKILVFFAFVFIFNTLQAQDEHHEHNNEIGIANAIVRYKKEKATNYGLHLHYIKAIKQTKFGLGLGYERIFDEHKHQSITLVTQYRPIDRLSLIVAPGILFEKDEKGSFSTHFEVSYEWELRYFHLGPVLEFAYETEDVHYSVGLHVGYDF